MTGKSFLDATPIFQERPDVFCPTLRKIPAGFEVNDNDSWVFMNALKQFFQGHIPLTIEINALFPDVSTSGEVSETGTGLGTSVPPDALCYRKLKKRKTFSDFVNRAAIGVFYY